MFFKFQIIISDSKYQFLDLIYEHYTHTHTHTHTQLIYG